MENDWVDFEVADTFQPAGIESAKRNERSRRRKKKNRRSERYSPETIMTWMEKPVNDDFSWMPIAPPPTQQTLEERDDVPADPRRSNGTPVSRPPLIGQGGSSTGSEGNSNATRTTSSSTSLSRSAAQERVKKKRSSRARTDRETRDKPDPPPSTLRTRGRTTSRGGDSPNNPITSPSMTRVEAPPSERGRRRARSTSRTRIESPSPRTHPRVRSTSRTRVESPSPQARSGRVRSSSRTRVESPSPLTRDSRNQSSSSRVRSSGRTRVESPSPSTRNSRARSSSNARIEIMPSSQPPRLPPSRCVESGSRGRAATACRSATRSRSLSRSRGAISSVSPRQRTAFHSSNSVGNGMPPHRMQSFTDRSVSSEQLGQSKKSTRKEGGLVEKLFGDQVSHNQARSNVSLGSIRADDNSESIHHRVLLSATVYKNAATNLWIATINTNQKGVATNPKLASKYLKAFSFGSEQEAREAAIANAPPKMMLFEECPSCFVCKGKFAVFRRARHCRNCGACVCAGCTTTWSSRMLPETYNLKNENTVNICKSCNYLTDSFQKALLKGDLELALELYHTGNINLRCPLPTAVTGTKKAEIMYPIHCAVHGGNLDVVRWLVDEHFCPIKIVKKGNGKGRSSDTAVVTSKGRSVLNIALQGLKVDIIRYLVVDKGVPLYETKDLQLSLRALEAVLLAFPASHAASELNTHEVVIPRWDDTNFSGDEGSYVCSSLGEDQSNLGDLSFRENTPIENMDLCILCYDNTIDCVITPCGHQICCLACSRNLKTCPVCNVGCSIIQIFKP